MSPADPKSLATLPSLATSSATGMQAPEATARSYGGGPNTLGFTCDAPVCSYGSPTHDELVKPEYLVARQVYDFGSATIPSTQLENSQYEQDYCNGAGHMAAKAVHKYGETLPERAEVIKSAIHEAAKDWTWDNAPQAIDAIGSMSRESGHPL
jgi:hypothetical protein